MNDHQENNNEESKIEVNKFARRERHARIFDRKQRVKVKWKGVRRSLKNMVARVLSVPGLSTVRDIVSGTKEVTKEMMPDSPKKRLFFQATVASLVLLFMSSINTNTYSALSISYEEEYIDAYYLPGEVLVSDDYGFLVKINPQTADSNRIGLTDFALHKVESGETLSQVAERYGVSVNTILWENNIGNANSIRIGQQLYIPPVDGLSYTVQRGDSLEELAEDYEIEVDSIVAQNGLDDGTIRRGQKIFLPGAEKKAPVVVATRPSYTSSGTSVPVASVNYNNVPAATSVPSGSKPFIFPTRGRITQGYRAGHYAYDIADRSSPPIWAAGSGTVTKVSVGTWGGGYGNHIVVDHGGGLRTLYAHLASVNVSVGQYVTQGDVLGIMGTTGRSTGIHLHWEVISNGVKQYPGNYY